MVDTPEKFLFDLNDFSDDTPVNAEDVEQSFSEDELNRAREESFKLGVQDATQKIRQEQDERSLACFEKITAQLTQLIQAENQRALEKSLDTTRLTLSIVKKLMPYFSETYSQAEITSLIKQSLKDRPDEPRLVVVVHDTLLDPLREKIDDIAKGQAFQGQVVIIADETMSPQDCRVEWADGGIEREFKVVYNAIEQSFHSVLQRLNIDEFVPEPIKEEGTVQDVPIDSKPVIDADPIDQGDNKASESVTQTETDINLEDKS